MKFAIVSDTHDNIKNFLKIIDYLNSQNIKTIVHCGDICSQKTIDEAEEKFNGEIIFVKGNGDYNLENYLDVAELDLGGKMVAAVHYPDLARKLAEGGKYDLVFYGHTHRPWEEKVNNCRLVNPGEVAGQRFKATFAVYDTASDTLELKVLEKM